MSPKALICFFIRDETYMLGTFLEKGTMLPIQIEKSTKSNLVSFKVGDLNFGRKPFCEGLPLWAGGEGDAIGLRRRYKNDFTRGEENRCEIWEIPHGGFLILIDKYGGIRLVESYQDEIKFVVPFPEAIIAYFKRQLKKAEGSANDDGKKLRIGRTRHQVACLLGKFGNV